MIRTVFAAVAAALFVAAVSVSSQAAPIAPLAGAATADSGTLTQVYWHHHHCWRGPHGHLHCRYW